MNGHVTQPHCCTVYASNSRLSKPGATYPSSKKLIPCLLQETYIEAYEELRAGEGIGDRGGLTPTWNRQLPDRHLLEWGYLIKGAIIKMELIHQEIE